jgi:glycine cleavage system H protein
MMVPVELHYTKDHEWVRTDQATGTIGITDHAQNELGDIVFVELPKPGDRVAAKESLGTVESVKAVSDIFSPVSGEVLAVNTKLQDKPELMNSDPYGEGWLVRVNLSEPHELESLMSSEEYAAYVQDKAAH